MTLRAFCRRTPRLCSRMYDTNITSVISHQRRCHFRPRSSIQSLPTISPSLPKTPASRRATEQAAGVYGGNNRDGDCCISAQVMSRHGVTRRGPHHTVGLRGGNCCDAARRISTRRMSSRDVASYRRGSNRQCEFIPFFFFFSKTKKMVRLFLDFKGKTIKEMKSHCLFDPRQ